MAALTSNGRARVLDLDKIKVPLPLAVGRYDLLTDKELEEHLHDCIAEAARRLESRPDGDR